MCYLEVDSLPHTWTLLKILFMISNFSFVVGEQALNDFNTFKFMGIYFTA